MAYGEVYTALEQGVIDGAEAARTNYYAKRFYEVAPHWAEIGWMFIVSPLIMSERFYEVLSAEEQEAIHQAARMAIRWEREEYQRQEADALQKLLESGVQLTRPDRADFYEAARQVWLRSADRVDMELVESIVGAAK
jgi:TRAP-type C4-dicarboxylate transport system substrate-binding protein